MNFSYEITEDARIRQEKEQAEAEIEMTEDDFLVGEDLSEND